MSYITDAADLFLSLNPGVPFLSPFDYVLLAEWEKQEIPLLLVLNAIREFSGEKRIVQDDHFSDIKQAVKVNYAAWVRNGVAGRSEPDAR